MKKVFVRIALAAGTVGAIVAGSAAFSAFEAHVVNVTATITNATDLNTEQLLFGNVFPQEILHNPVTIKLSDSFLSGSNTLATSVDYVLKQKPKCMADSPNTQPQFVQVQDANIPPAPTVFVCPQGYHKMPLLCPYLSKTSPTPGDKSIPSFHGPTDLASWTDNVSVDNQAVGHLSKNGITSTTWDIDLHVPCFKNECAQDWASFVHTANPSVVDPVAYEADPANKGVVMGCDLWYEVSGINNLNACTVQNVQSVVSDTTNTVEGAGSAAALSFIHPAWTASIPGATWIWSTDPVSNSTVDDTETFNKTFNVPSTATNASLDIAVDNFYTVFVNGVQLGSEQGVENNFQSGTQDHYVVSNLVVGANTIKVVATNKGLSDSTPASNPAGVLYKLTFTTTDACNN